MKTGDVQMMYHIIEDVVIDSFCGLFLFVYNTSLFVRIRTFTGKTNEDRLARVISKFQTRKQFVLPFLRSRNFPEGVLLSKTFLVKWTLFGSRKPCFLWILMHSFISSSPSVALISRELCAESVTLRYVTQVCKNKKQKKNESCNSYVFGCAGSENEFHYFVVWVFVLPKSLPITSLRATFPYL